MPQDSDYVYWCDTCRRWHYVDSVIGNRHRYERKEGSTIEESNTAASGGAPASGAGLSAQGAPLAGWHKRARGIRRKATVQGGNPQVA